MESTFNSAAATVVVMLLSAIAVAASQEKCGKYRAIYFIILLQRCLQQSRNKFLALS
jgi:hypothetical protein